MWKKLKGQLFNPILVADDNKPVRHIWMGDDETSILINPNTNRILHRYGTTVTGKPTQPSLLDRWRFSACMRPNPSSTSAYAHSHTAHST
jgi:hypothetical protein